MLVKLTTVEYNTSPKAKFDYLKKLTRFKHTVKLLKHLQKLTKCSPVVIPDDQVFKLNQVENCSWQTADQKDGHDDEKNPEKRVKYIKKIFCLLSCLKNGQI
jgi:hypothetical protein